MSTQHTFNTRQSSLENVYYNNNFYHFTISAAKTILKLGMNNVHTNVLSIKAYFFDMASSR